MVHETKNNNIEYNDKKIIEEMENLLEQIKECEKLEEMTPILEKGRKLISDSIQGVSELRVKNSTLEKINSIFDKITDIQMDKIKQLKDKENNPGDL